MKKNTKQLNKIIKVLNSAYEADPAAVHALICNRVPCNLALARHPTVQVEQNKVSSKDSYAVGLLGMLNGIVEPITGGRVAIAFSAPDQNKARRIIGFVEYKEK